MRTQEVLPRKHEARGRILLLYMQRLGTGNLYRITEPLGLKCLAAFVEARGYVAEVFSGSAHEAVSLLDRTGRGLDCVGLYCDYENRSVVESFCRKVKARWPIRVFIGGPQAVALDERFHRESLCDAVVRGEGEEPLLELLELFVHGCGKLDEIAGVSFLDERGGLVTVPPRPPLSCLDDLPIRDTGSYPECGDEKSSLAVLTGRGCPFRCAFCYEGSVPGKVRLRSVPHVMAEIRQGLKQNPGIKYIWFADDTFTLDPRRMESFSRELAALRREHDFIWFCECHPGTLVKWPDMLPMMIESGLVRMQIGMESGSRRVIGLYNKQATLEQIESVVEHCMRCGLPQLAGNMIVGGAAETRETFEETKRFTERLLRLGPGMTDITSTFFLPLPKTAITLDPAAFGLKILDEESITSMGDVAVAETEALSRQEITSMRTEFTHHVRDTMLRLYAEGAIPEERIRGDFHLKLRYGIESGWQRFVFSSDPSMESRYAQPVEGTARKAPVPEVRLEADSGSEGGSCLVDRLRRSLDRTPGILKRVFITEEVFPRAVEEIQSLKGLRDERDFAWCLQCGLRALLNHSAFVRNLADSGPVRVELAVEPTEGESIGGRDLDEAVAFCLEAGVAQVAGRIVLREPFERPEALRAMLDSVEERLQAAPGFFEWEASLEGSDSVRQAFHDRRTACMRRVAAERRIGHETLLRHFTLFERYGISSVWYREIFEKTPAIFNYYTLIARGATIRSEEASGSLDEWRPQRTLSLWASMDFSEGYPRIGRYVLSPLEYDLLLHASGKLTLRQVLDVVHPRFGGFFDDFESFRKAALSVYKTFEDKLWLVYAEI